MSEHISKPLGGKIFTWPIIFFGILILIGLYAITHRFVSGIGAVSDLNGGFPWGLWIAFDLLVGTGFACGGWALAWTVYVFNQGQYHPMVRSALLASLFGYSLGGFSILIDVGRYWNVPYFYIPGFFNVNSVLFETAFCMTVYVFVVMFEFAPVICERLGWKISLRKMNKVMFAAISLGVLLPTMHQSSMGSLFNIAGLKLHPLWRSGAILGPLSLLTALIMGFAIVIFEGSITRAGLRGKDVADETPLFAKLYRIIRWLIIAFFILRFGELALGDKMQLLFVGDRGAWLFWLETALLAAPLYILSKDKFIKDARWLFGCAISMMLGAALWRMNLSLFTFNPGDGYSYFPTAEEILISIGLVAMEICGFILIVKYFPVISFLAPKKENGQKVVTDEAHNEVAQ
ncbi:Ni/Fe-hydrogenase cytochrome b subunit [Desulforhopalus vacuolatus]|uniref:Ni/Fe-hydrogenase cytochrome b subunit n=1 Tax=Desulforhopalus vacuolatus TaxID=40414 RepID=UPI0034DE7E9C